MDFWFRLSLRTRIGCIGFVSLAAAIGLLVAWPYSFNLYSLPQVGGIFVFGTLFTLAWLAWKDMKNIPWWYWICIIAMIIICAIKPILWFIAIPAICYILFGRRRQ